MHPLLWNIRNLLARKSDDASVYNRIQRFVGNHRLYHNLIQAYFPTGAPYRILDIGCGTAEIVHHLPDNIEYIGIDLHQKYITAAQSLFPQHRFICGDCTNLEQWSIPQADVVCLLGVLHHLPNHQAEQVLHSAMAYVAPHGILLTLDGCREANISKLEDFFYAVDRGRYIRNKESYERLFRFSSKSKPIDSKLVRWLHVPYQHLICVYQRGADV